MRSIFQNIILLVVALFLWQLLSIYHLTFISSPIEILLALYTISISGDIFAHIFASLARVTIGFSIASFLGVALALVTGYYKKTSTFIWPIVEFFRPIPPIAWIPLAILIFGLGNPSAYFIVFIGAFFPIFTNTLFGINSLPRIYVNVARSFEIRKSTFIKDILFKFSLPYIFTGLKVGIGMAWMSVIAAELIGAQSGLGYFIQLNRLLLRTDNIIAGMIIIGAVGYSLVKILSFVERKIILWKI